MIYTVTLNPSLDYVIEVDRFQTGQINRASREHLYYGGKGINVSCILHELGEESTALGFIAGYSGRMIQDGLRENGICTDFVEVKQGFTRINVKLNSEEETEINGVGPLIKEAEFEELKRKLERLKQGDTLILSGSVPSCLRVDAYEELISSLKEEVTLVIDIQKNLFQLLKYRPFLIKPNHHELAELFHTELSSEEKIIQNAKRLQDMGARNVLVSLAEQGAILLDETGTIHHAPAASGTVVNSVGAGDSMVAGFLAGYRKTNDYAYALTLGTACGGATVFQSGLASNVDIETVLAQLHWQ
ncbi:MAG: 1-phosphofructokinase [Solobacterium sp.]|nr:1-phosphofructokinase [Solobacterium sp.]